MQIHETTSGKNKGYANRPNDVRYTED